MRVAESLGGTLVVLALQACAEPEASNFAATDDETTASAESTTSGSGPDGDGSSVGTDDMAPEPFVPVVARGITIDDVEVNQGIGIALARGGSSISVAASVLSDRRTLLRARWIVDDDWTARDVEARLTLRYPDGSEITRPSVLWVEGPPSPDPMARTFEWVVEPEDMQDGVEYSIALWEAAAGFEDEPEPATPPVVPLAPIPIRAGEFGLKIVVVPIEYDTPGCATAPDTSATGLQPIVDEVMMRLPLNALELSVRSPITIAAPLTQGVDIINRVGAVRASDNPDPNVIYLGLIDHCGDVAAGGQAWTQSLPPTPDESALRVGWVRWYSYLAPETAHSFVHELAHTLGRDHVLCTGTEDMVDSAYPIEGGGIGDRLGWGTVDLSWHDPATHADYMSYCRPGWTSAYGWELLVPVIEAMAAWSSAGSRAPKPPLALMAARVPGQPARRWMPARVRLRSSDRRASEHALWTDHDGVVSERPVYVRPLNDGRGEWVVIPLPEGTTTPGEVRLRQRP